MFGALGHSGRIAGLSSTHLLNLFYTISCIFSTFPNYDWPAFRKASVSIGVISDKRLIPKLDRQYLIEFNNLSNFLERLEKDEFIFSEDFLI